MPPAKKKEPKKTPKEEIMAEPEKVKFKKPTQREPESPKEVEIVALKKHAFEPLPQQEEVS